MIVVGIAMVKDECDVIEDVVRHMLGNVDAVIVSDNGSTDGTREKLKQLAIENDALQVIDDPEIGYYQSRKMSKLAEQAVFYFGASWVIPFDADEIWLPFGGASKAGRPLLKEVLAKLPDNERIATATLYDHVATADDKGGSPFMSMTYRRKHPGPLPKVAARATSPVIIEQGNHGANYGVATPNPVLEIRHFPLRSAEHMIRKARNGAAAYAATDLDHSLGAHWRDWGKLSDDQLREAFHRYYYSENPRRVAALKRDPVLL